MLIQDYFNVVSPRGSSFSAMHMDRILRKWHVDPIATSLNFNEALRRRGYVIAGDVLGFLRRM